jgi:hypothetical protein
METSSMEPDPKQDLDEERRAQLEVHFRRVSHIQLAGWLSATIFYLGFLVLALRLGFWEDYWPMATIVLFGGGAITWISILKNNRCPICDNFFGKALPTRTRKICPSCGTQLIN